MTEFYTSLSTSKLHDESNVCISEAESFISDENLMAARHARVDYDAECSSDNSNEDVALFNNTISFGRGRILSNYNYLRNVGLRGKRN